MIDIAELRARVGLEPADEVHIDGEYVTGDGRPITADLLNSIVPDTPVTKLPEVHDPAGDSLSFHIPAGRATQVLGSREIDIARIPDTQNVTVTDSSGRALPTRSAIAREKAITDALAGNEKLAKLMRKYGAKRFSFTMSR